MNEFVNSLAEISSTYTVFEKDQILTERQLNSITDYLDPQDRLTRINLFGVGILSGLTARLVGAQVKLASGLGITTDGDLICQGLGVSFSSFKEYGLESPKYAPLYQNDSTMFPAWELIRAGESDSVSSPLSQFNATTGKNLASLVAVLLFEDYIKDEDFCQLDGCENVGKDRLSTIKLLVMEQGSLAKLRHGFLSASDAYEALQPIVSQRAIINGASNTIAKFTADNRNACKAMHTSLVNTLPLLSKHYDRLIAPIVSPADITQWLKQLTTYASEFKGSQLGIQYYYDFLTDLCSVWNELCSKAPLSLVHSCPDINAFPKHLILGGLTSSSASLERFEFYPSTKQVANSSEDEFVFLVVKLDAMISAFMGSKVRAENTLKITPSQQNPGSSGDAAIPFYYRILARRPIHQHWNFELSQRGKGNWNYGFRAPEFAAVGSAAQPLQSRIDSFSFFRVEGHIRRNVRTVQKQLEQLITENALPFTLRTALLGNDRKKIIKKKGLRYNDLHRFHRLIRMDISHQLEEVKSFSNVHQSNITMAINNNVIQNDNTENNAAKVSDLSVRHHNNINNKATLAQNVMKMDYIAFKANNSWQPSIFDTMASAGQYKRDLGKVTKTDFSTPFDGLIDNTRVNWLPWLGSLIDEKDKKEDERMMLAELLKQHPGLNHAAGVPSGGTLVLIYDNNGTVVGDCMSPCCIPEPEIIEQPEEPELPKPPIRPPFIIDSGVFLNPTLDLFFNKKFAVEKIDIDKRITQELNIQEQVVSSFKESFSIYSNSMFKMPVEVAGGNVVGGSSIGNKNPGSRAGLLGRLLETRVLILEQQKKELENPGLSATERNNIMREKEKSEAEIVKEVQKTVTALSAKNVSVETGSEGGKTITQLISAMRALEGNPQARNRAVSVVSEAQERTTNTKLKKAFNLAILR